MLLSQGSLRLLLRLPLHLLLRLLLCLLLRLLLHLRQLLQLEHMKQLQLQQQLFACQTVTMRLLQPLKVPYSQHLSHCRRVSTPDPGKCQCSPRHLCHHLAGNPSQSSLPSLRHVWCCLSRYYSKQACCVSETTCMVLRSNIQSPAKVSGCDSADPGTSLSDNELIFQTSGWLK